MDQYAVKDIDGKTLNQFNGVEFKEKTGTTHTVVKNDHADILEMNNAATITVTLPNNVPPGFHCVIQKTGAGNVVLSVEGTLRSENSYTTITTQNKCITIIKRDATVWVAIGVEA